MAYEGVEWGNCEMYVEGAGLKCPMCGYNVPSGYAHRCERRDGRTTMRSTQQRKDEGGDQA